MTRTTSILFWFSLIIVASLGLYRTSDHVAELDRQLNDINSSIDAEKQSIHVLKAEWSYLSNPSRIAAISKKHSALRPTAPQQVATIDALPDMLPTRVEAAVALAAVNGTPMATVRSTLVAKISSQQAAILRHRVSAKPVALAASDSGHLRDHMIMVQHTASAAPIPGDSIGALIGELSQGR
jgi:cell division protein FtsL